MHFLCPHGDVFLEPQKSQQKVIKNAYKHIHIGFFMRGIDCRYPFYMYPGVVLHERPPGDTKI